MDQPYVVLPRGLHVWGPEDHALSGIPDDVVERRSQRYRQHHYETPQGWSQVDGDNVVVIGDLPDKAMKLVASTGDEIVEMLTREFGVSKQAPRYLVRIFSKREDFCSYAWECEVPATAVSMYNPRKAETALHFGERVDPEDFENIYAHELTHAFMDRVYGVTEPLWFAEGMAEYFANLNWTKQGYRPSGKNEYGMIHLSEELFPLKRVLAATQEDMNEDHTYYAQSWGLVRFLLKHHPDLIKVLLNRRGKLNLGYLSSDYMAYLKRLRGD